MRLNESMRARYVDYSYNTFSTGGKSRRLFVSPQRRQRLRGVRLGESRVRLELVAFEPVLLARFPGVSEAGSATLRVVLGGVDDGEHFVRGGERVQSLPQSETHVGALRVRVRAQTRLTKTLPRTRFVVIVATQLRERRVQVRLRAGEAEGNAGARGDERGGGFALVVVSFPSARRVTAGALRQTHERLRRARRGSAGQNEKRRGGWLFRAQEQHAGSVRGGAFEARD